MDILDVFVLAGRGSARASEDRGAWLKGAWSTFPCFWMPLSWGSLTTRARSPHKKVDALREREALIWVGLCHVRQQLLHCRTVGRCEWKKPLFGSHIEHVRLCIQRAATLFGSMAGTPGLRSPCHPCLMNYIRA